MLQIKNISKQYKTGELVQRALDGVSLNFRDNEFVSILGPSGSGKTTLLNIVGGLDRYDSGDLIINNVSTKNYKDRDWDSYRNHTIGFVFQSYNLIPHQTVLSNVELALTIGGISKKERKARALEALEQVGLRDQAHKRPNQMSGGQMQRVAIARALVNNPDILLADEPTGALDTETSVQVMNLLKQVAKDRLVIMVTHNPELAEEYSTRIVKLRDGKIVDDSDPFVVDESLTEPPKHKNLGKASMSFFTAMALSFNNLLTKKGRTLLTAFAGSIGIIGIALILSLSTGFQNYIDKIQEDTLTSYPLTLTSDTADTTAMLLGMTAGMGEEKEDDVVSEQQFISSMFSSIGKNDLTSFMKYMDEHQEEINKWVSLTRYHYNIKPIIYTKNDDYGLGKLNPSSFLDAMGGGGGMSTIMATTGGSSVFNEMIDDREALESQYDVLAGKWPESYDEAILVLPSPNSMPDMLVYGIGLRDTKELEDMLSKIMAGEAVENKDKPLEFTYDELLNLDFRVVDATDTYKYNEKYDIYESMEDDKAFMEKVYNDSLRLKIVGIVTSKEGASSTSLSPGVAYTKALTEYVINTAEKSPIVQKQLADETVNVFSGKRFDDDSEETGLDFQDMVSVDEQMLSEAFNVNIDEQTITSMTQGYMTEISSAISADTAPAKEAFLNTLGTLMADLLNTYIEENKDPMMGVAILKAEDVEKVVSDYMNGAAAASYLAKLEESYVVPAATFKGIYQPMILATLQAYVEMTSQMNLDNPSAYLMSDVVEPMVTQLVTQEMVVSAAQQMATGMTEAVMQKTILTKVGELTGKLMGTMANAFNVDESKFAEAFQFNMSEEEVARLFETMSKSGMEVNVTTNLMQLGYQKLEEPSQISFYFKDFESKEFFTEFLDAYNDRMESEDEEKVIRYTDLTGFLMSSVKTIVDSVSYVLIAFVSISLVVSSIMIGIITYISVFERTKEIGVLRAIGASKRNISSIFNAETFIVGLCAGVIGIGTSLLLLFPINYIIHSVTDNENITAVLPTEGATVLVILSIILTLIGGLIPSRQAAKKDPVLALRSE